MNKTVSFARHQAVGAYRRWEPPDFGVPALPIVVRPELVPEPGAVVSPPPVMEELPGTEPYQAGEEAETALPPIPLPTVEEIEQIHEEARRSGFDEGLAEGRGKGYSEGRETGFREGREAGFSEGKAASANEARQLHELVTQLEQALTKFDTEIAEELMSFAVELARKIIQHTLAVEPEAVVSAIRAVLQTLPQSRAQIHLNPDDIALARIHLGEVLDQAGHVLIEDETVSRGGCRVETPGAQIDATMETRWRRTIESMGREHSPWAPASERRTKSRRASDKPDARKESKVKDSPGPTVPEAPSGSSR
ncbi:MAG: flagellar assembly protein FliH [Azoarcus sp.]|jgi:flagellar assembly protein FliH|nr:flagellar assembly protein FliH [Azoarcus sp.]